MLLQHTGDQCGELLACRIGHLGEERYDTVLAPGKPRLEVEMLLGECIGEKLRSGGQSGGREYPVDGQRRRFGCDVARAAFQQLSLSREVRVHRRQRDAGLGGDLGIGRVARALLRVERGRELLFQMPEMAQ